MTSSGIPILFAIIILMVPVVGLSQEVLFDSAGVYIQRKDCVTYESSNWTWYELVIQGNSHIGDSIFFVNNFEAFFPSLDSLDYKIIRNADLPVPAELFQDSTICGVAREQAENLSNFDLRLSLLIKAFSKNDVRMSIGWVEVKIILYGLIHPIMNNRDTIKRVGRPREWSKIVSVPVDLDGRPREWSDRVSVPFTIK